MALRQPPESHLPAGGRVDDRSSLASRVFDSSAFGLRLAALAVAAMALAYAGTLAWPSSPWSWIALPAGLAIASVLRLGAAMGAAATAGLVLAMLTARQSLGATAVAALTLLAICGIAVRTLGRIRFDARLERARDIVALAAVLPLAAVVPTALAAALVAASRGQAWVPVWEAGFSIVTLGMLLAMLAGLAVDQRLLQAVQPQADWRENLLALLAALAAAGAPLLAPAGSAPGMALAFLAMPVVFAVLSLRGHFMLAALGLLVAALTAASASRSGVWPPGLAREAAPLLGAWTLTSLASLLASQAATVGWRGRAQRWEWALDGSRLGVADWHLQRGDGFASTAWRTLTAFTSRRWTPKAWVAQVHPDDEAALERALDVVGSGAAGRQLLELRMPHAGGWRWFEATLLVIERDPDGQPTRLLATLADIDERHEAQERQLMSVSLFQHLHEGLLVTDSELRALDVNPAYVQILGVTREETLGAVPSLLRPDPADPQARAQRAAMWTSLREEGKWRGELFERRRSGEMCTLQATISTVLGPARDLRYHVVVISDITEQRVQREQLERQAHFDELTRLPNRARLSRLLDEAMAASDRDGYLLVVCYLDLDHFKPVNDRFGHAAGDGLLAELAGRLRSALRSRESWADVAARLGGDEFVLLLRAGTIDEARLAVERVLRVVAQPYMIHPDEGPVQVSASMGATIYPIDRSDADTLLRHADNAMYGAKQAGRNGYLFFDPEHRRRTEERVMAIGRVQEALDLSEFVLFYQPKVDMRSGKVLGLEALLRWDHPQQGLIAPLQFLPLIENTGLSSRVGDWVLAQALDHLVQWQRAGLDLSVSVNVSARHLQEPDFALRLSELLARHAEPLAERLELEMLETAAHADIESTSALLGRCRALGVRFALDDFGTGYSTLTYLKRLPVDVLKIDRSFVHHMLDDAHDRAIVEGVIGLARTFGCTVVAEGVESPAQARTLLELGCDIGQGTGIAAPMRAEQVAQWVRDYRGMFALAPANPPAGGAGASAAPAADDDARPASA